MKGCLYFAIREIDDVPLFDKRSADTTTCCEPCVLCRTSCTYLEFEIEVRHISQGKLLVQFRARGLFSLGPFHNGTIWQMLEVNCDREFNWP